MTSRDQTDAHSLLLLLSVAGVLLVVFGVAIVGSTSSGTDASTGLGTYLGLAMAGLGGLMALVAVVGWGVRLGVLAASQDAREDDSSSV